MRTKYYLVSAALLLFGFFFHKYYFFFIDSKRLTPLMRTSLWVIEMGWILAALIVVFFQKFLYRHRKKILLALVSVLFSVVLAEGVFRLTDHRSPKFSPHHYLSYFGTPGYTSADGSNMHNSLGLRGPEIAVPKPTGVYRIALLGGSWVYEEAVSDWSKDFARQLEAALKKKYPNKEIEVINAGVSGYTSWENFISIPFLLLPLEPDLLVLYTGVNDVHARFVIPSSYKADNSGRRSYWKKTPCLVVFCLKIVQHITGIDPDTSAGVDADTFFLPNEIPAHTSRLGLRPMEVLDANPPIYTKQNLINSIAMAQIHDIRVMLATWAYSDMFRDYVVKPYYKRGIVEHNNVVQAVGKEMNIPVYDFAKDMPMDKKYWADGRHNNEEGVKLKAEFFALHINL